MKKPRLSWHMVQMEKAEAPPPDGSQARKMCCVLVSGRRRS